MDFEKLFQALNKEQQDAVESIEGPVLTIAGPGTGKTQILAVRIANILRKQQINPENILAITFTESGVMAIKNRLRKIVGARTAYKVNVFTFHGLCNKIISENPNIFATAKGLKQMDDYDSIQLCREMLDTNKFLNLISVKNKYYYVSEIRSLISTCKKESVSPQAIVDYCTDRSAALNMIVEEKGKATNVIKKELASLERMVEFANFFQIYIDKTLSKGMYDFDDMINSVNSAFNENEDLLYDYQEKFQYFLVDEFQDSNNSQNSLITKLCSHFDSPNLFVVGDDDQSIYRFQGASLENILNVRDKYPDIKEIVLSENYRSNQKILNIASGLISNNVERLVTDKKLRSNNLNSGSVFFSEYEDVLFESYDLALKIQKLTTDGVSPNEIAVLTANNGLVSNFVHFLDHFEIPYFMHSGSNLYEHPMFIFFLNLFSYFDDPTNDLALFKVLYDPNLGIDKTDLFNIYLVRSKVKGKSLIEIIDSEEFNFSDDFKSLINQLKNLSVMSLSENAVTVFRRSLYELSVISRLQKRDDFIDNLSALNNLFTELKANLNSNPKMTILDFAKRIQVLTESKVKSSIEFVSGGSGVQIMTAHKSKGLEFEHVFIPYCTSNVWEENKRSASLKLPIELTLKHSDKNEEIDEKRRLFYVALTRAKNSLYLSYSKADSTLSREYMPSLFLDELPEDYLTRVTPDVSDMDAIIVNLSENRTNNSHDVQKFKSRISEHSKNNFRLSPTALASFLECKRRFLYQDIFKVPTPQSNALIIGSVIHKILEEKFGKEQLKSENILNRIEEIVGQYGLNFNEHELVKNSCYDLVSKWLNNSEVPEKVLYTEFNLVNKDIYIGSVPVNGKVDRIDKISDLEVEVIDYKSGKPTSRTQIQGLTKGSSGKYYKQLMFYALMLKNDRSFKFNVKSAKLEFLEENGSGKFKSERFEFSNDELSDFEAEIHTIYDQILTLSFLDENGDIDCECGKCII